MLRPGALGAELDATLQNKQNVSGVPTCEPVQSRPPVRCGASPKFRGAHRRKVGHADYCGARQGVCEIVVCCHLHTGHSQV